MFLNQWLGLAFLLIVLGVVFAPDFLLWPVFLAFGGMMETSKSRRLVHVGIALALGGPVLIALTIGCAALCAHAGLGWSARFFGVTTMLLFLSWVVSGGVVGVVKGRHAAREQVPAAKAEQPE